MIIKPFNKLSTAELYHAIHLREKVFVVEQKCYYLDADNNDQKSWHLLYYSNDTLAAYLRILPPNTTYKQASIGRVVVDKQFRGKNIAREIMTEAIKFLNTKYNGRQIKIGAQTYLNSFYKSLGFINEGQEYLEDGIPHIHMLLG
jgi:ElaA protein